MRCVEFFKDALAVDASDSDSESGNGAEEKGDPPGHKTKSIQNITNDNGTIVAPTITDASDSLGPAELAVRNEVTGHLSSAMMLPRKHCSIYHEIASASDQLKFVIGLSIHPPLVGAGEWHLGTANIPASVINYAARQHDSGLINEQVVLL